MDNSQPLDDGSASGSHLRPNPQAYNYRNTIGTSDIQRIRHQTLRERAGRPRSKQAISSDPINVRLVFTKRNNFAPGSMLGKKNLEYTNKQTGRMEVFRSWKEIRDIWLNWHHLKTTTLYKAALFEMIGTMLLVFLSLSIIMGMTNYFNYSREWNHLSEPPLPLHHWVSNWRITFSIGLLHSIFIAFLILSLAPASGAHLNPTITLTTMFCGYIPLVKGIVYMIAQFTGGILACSFLYAAVPWFILDRTHMAACDYGGDFDLGQILCLEALLTFYNLFMSFTIAIDPRQSESLGAIPCAFILSTSIGLTQVLAGSYAYTYSGPGYNMARCLGPAILMGYWHRIWVFFVAQIIASLLTGLIFLLNPPFKTVKSEPVSEPDLELNRRASISNIQETDTGTSYI